MSVVEKSSLAVRVGLHELNESCTRNGQCQSNLCYKRTCGRPWEVGQFCQPSLRNCPVGLHCDWRSQTCVPQFYAPPTDGTCRQQSDCLPDQFCSDDSKCQKRGAWAHDCQVNEQCSDGYGCYDELCLQKCVRGYLGPDLDCPPGFTCAPEQLCLPDRYFLRAYSEEDRSTVIDRVFPFVVLIVIGLFMLAFAALSFSQCWEESRRRQLAREKRTAAKAVLEPVCRMTRTGASSNVTTMSHANGTLTSVSIDSPPIRDNDSNVGGAASPPHIVAIIHL